MDLHTFLPAEFKGWNSEAFGITHVGGVPYVVGYAYNGSGQAKALLWVGTAPCPGDLDGNRVVDLSDLSIALSNYGLFGATYAQGDVDGDLDVDLSDLVLLLGQYGTTCP